MNRSTMRNAFVLGMVAFVIAPLMMLLGAINFFSVDRTRGAKENWAAEIGSWEHLMQRYPATEANASALEVERLSMALGITISPRSTERAKAEKGREKSLSRLTRKAFDQYFAAQTERLGRGAVGAPPVELQEFLAEHADELNALQQHLVHSETPIWESDFSKMQAAPIPNLLGQINLQKLLTTTALAQLAEGDREGALESIHASWALARSLWDSPVMMCQLIYMAATRLQIGVLRLVPDLPAVWAERLQEHDFRESFLTSMKLEGWAWLHLPHVNTPNNVDPWGSGNASSWLKTSAFRMVRPYVALCMADLSDKWREHVALLERTTPWCDRDLVAEGAVPNIKIPRWNHFGDTLVPNLLGATTRLSRLEVDRELLLLAIEADAARRSGTGTLSSIAPPRPAQSCQGDHWIYTPTPDGLELTLSRPIEWPVSQRPPILPTRLILN